MVFWSRDCATLHVLHWREGFHRGRSPIWQAFILLILRLFWFVTCWCLDSLNCPTSLLEPFFFFLNDDLQLDSWIQGQFTETLAWQLYMGLSSQRRHTAFGVTNVVRGGAWRICGKSICACTVAPVAALKSERLKL